MLSALVACQFPGASDWLSDAIGWRLARLTIRLGTEGALREIVGRGSLDN